LPTAQRIVENRLGNPFNDINVFKSKLPAGLPPTTATMDVKSAFFLVTLDTSIGRHERHTEALLQRDASRSTTVLWHRPQPLIGPSSDEPDESPSSMESNESGKSPQ
jgi:hypothetical protein